MGVGTANIFGRVHTVQLKLADLFLPCSITIIEVGNTPLSTHDLLTFFYQLQGSGVDLLFGLDMLKAHQACIDLSKNVLRIQGREVEFLPEHELPEMARREARGELDQSATMITEPSSSTAPSGSQSFPGSGNALGAPPVARQSLATSQASPSRHPEASIKTLMDLGVTRDVAIRSLDAANGNVDLAASLLF
ncbi:hypothetical protein C0992_003572 [Termitomyces sp. T32_za158]|nr:hypothetical protein C0992_003572 [Termitomyces sp. T32_za158]